MWSSTHNVSYLVNPNYLLHTNYCQNHIWLTRANCSMPPLIAQVSLYQVPFSPITLGLRLINSYSPTTSSFPIIFHLPCLSSLHRFPSALLGPQLLLPRGSTRRCLPFPLYELWMLLILMYFMSCLPNNCSQLNFHHSVGA